MGYLTCPCSEAPASEHTAPEALGDLPFTILILILIILGQSIRIESTIRIKEKRLLSPEETQEAGASRACYSRAGALERE